jgi:hypothetical protein
MQAKGCTTKCGPTPAAADPRNRAEFVRHSNFIVIPFIGVTAIPSRAAELSRWTAYSS